MTDGLRTRRAVIAGAGAAGAGALIAGCSTYGGTPDTPPGQPTGDGATSAPSGPGKVIGETAVVPVGGGKVFEADEIVVTQPTSGVFKAFSGICTHQGCLVSSVADGVINCACHGSQFRIDDGSVAVGPATQRLATARIIIDGDTIRKG